MGALFVLLLHVPEDLGDDGLVFAAVLQCAWMFEDVIEILISFLLSKES